MATVGDNASTMGFLYDMSHSTRPFELDALRLRSEASPNAPIMALSFFNVIVFPKHGIRPDGIDLKQTVLNNITQVTRDLYEVATRAGARELALKDGIVRVVDGTNYVLIPEMPRLPGETGVVPENGVAPEPGVVPDQPIPAPADAPVDGAPR